MECAWNFYKYPADARELLHLCEYHTHNGNVLTEYSQRGLGL
jgi:hypothetical protein